MKGRVMWLLISIGLLAMPVSGVLAFTGFSCQSNLETFYNIVRTIAVCYAITGVILFEPMLRFFERFTKSTRTPTRDRVIGALFYGATEGLSAYVVGGAWVAVSALFVNSFSEVPLLATLIGGVVLFIALRLFFAYIIIPARHVNAKAWRSAYLYGFIAVTVASVAFIFGFLMIASFIQSAYAQVSIDFPTDWGDPCILWYPNNSLIVGAAIALALDAVLLRLYLTKTSRGRANATR